ncbi:hypothetical protein [Streptomyces sp. NPDC057909]|uniref:hypothetical protein n=1 Tax=Streptomyces sp. NPDC057909 TaxID=3346277 RepID=UPI0036E82779
MIASQPRPGSLHPDDGDENAGCARFDDHWLQDFLPQALGQLLGLPIAFSSGNNLGLIRRSFLPYLFTVMTTRAKPIDAPDEGAMEG